MFKLATQVVGIGWKDDTRRRRHSEDNWPTTR